MKNEIIDEDKMDFYIQQWEDAEIQEFKNRHAKNYLDGMVLYNLALKEHFGLLSEEESLFFYSEQVKTGLLTEEQLIEYYGLDFRIKYPNGNIMICFTVFFQSVWFIDQSIEDSYLIGDTMDYKIKNIIEHWKQTGERNIEY